MLAVNATGSRNTWRWLSEQACGDYLDHINQHERIHLNSLGAVLGYKRWTEKTEDVVPSLCFLSVDAMKPEIETPVNPFSPKFLWIKDLITAREKEAKTALTSTSAVTAC